jgi:hypothetical protein
MKIAVLSDTHARSFAEIPAKMQEALSDADLIVHCGDLVDKDVLDGLKRLKEVKAVRGNMDSPELRALLPEKVIFNAGGRTIGVTHGSGAPFGIEGKVKRMFEGNIDIILFGHSHLTQNKVIDGILFFNPGRCKNSFGLLTIEDTVKGEIIRI